VTYNALIFNAVNVETKVNFTEIFFKISVDQQYALYQKMCVLCVELKNCVMDKNHHVKNGFWKPK